MAAPVSSCPESHPETEIGMEIESSSPRSDNLRPAVEAIDTSSSAVAASTSTSANPHSNHSVYYDVFLSHRGPDVRKTLASHLYRRLLLHGMRVFLDRPNPQKGENFPSEIEDAIKTAYVHVAIFSQTYAASASCLNELLLMLKLEARIIPVFYGVKRDDLRSTQDKDGVYARALSNLEVKQSSEGKLLYESSIQNWREALFRVAEISGFDLESCNG